MEELAIAGLIVIGFILVNMHRRLDRLERRVASSGMMPAAGPVAVEPAASVVVAPHIAPAVLAVAAPGAGNTFLAWLREEWPMKVGALCLIAAVGWGVTYAFVNDIISAEGRVALGLLFGVGMSAWGVVRAGHARLQGDILLTVGAVSLLFTMFAGAGYGFFAPSVALLSMLLVTGLMLLSAAMQRDRMFAGVAVAFAALAAVLFYDDVPRAMTAWYALLSVAVAVAAAIYGGWTDVLLLTLLTSIFTTTLATPLFGFATEGAAVLYFCAVLGILAAGHTVVMTRRPSVRIDAVIAGIWGVLALAWSTGTLSLPEAQALLLTAIAVAVSGMTYLLWMTLGSVVQVLVYAGVAVGLLVGATAVVLDGPALTMAYTAEAAGLIAAGLVMLRSAPRRVALWAVGIAAFAIAAAAGMAHHIGIVERYAVGGVYESSGMYSCDYDDSYYATSGPCDLVLRPVALADIVSDLMAMVTVAVAAMGVVLLTIATVMGGTIRSAATRTEDLVGLRFFATMAGMFVAMILWDLLHLWLPPAVAVSLALTVYTVAGVGFYVAGSREHYQAYRVVGSVILTLVAVRLFLVDFWNMTMLWRVVTFGTVGTLLVGMALAMRRPADDRPLS